MEKAISLSKYMIVFVLLSLCIAFVGALSVQAQVVGTREITPLAGLQWGDSFNVTVTINVQESIDGLVLDEDLDEEPEDWALFEVLDETLSNFTYAPTLVDWANITGSSAGQTLVVRYRVTLPAGAGERQCRISGTLIVQEGLTQTTISVGGDEEFTVGGSAAPWCDLDAGWNLISLPVEPGSTDPEDVFVYDPLYLTQYNTAEGQFNWVDKPASATGGTVGTLTEVHALGGYWLATQEAGEYCVEGTALTGTQSIVMPSAGWYMIGVPYDVAWGDTSGSAVKLTHGGEEQWLPDAVEDGWLYGTILQWDAVAGEWIRTTTTEGVTLEPCIGYWIRTRVDDLTMTFTEEAWDPGDPPPPPPATQSLKSEDPGNPPMPAQVVPLSFDASKLEFTNYPNPITDVHTTTFAVKGVMSAFVDALRVQIFDLSGCKVYEEEMPGTSVDWHTDNDYGEYLANGVYLYKLYAKVQGQWVVSETRKLAILR